jgi:transglutaminase-like putative cysteine protease
MRYLRYFLFIFFLLLFVVNINAEPNNSLDFDAIKGKYIVVDINLTIPITINRYTPEDHLTFKTPIFYDSRSQKVTSEAYYYDNLNEKVYADIVKDEYGNSIAIFEIDSIQKPKYVFYINANVISENKIVLNNTHHSLDDPINDYNLYKESTRNMQSHASEIISLTNAIKESNNSLKEIVNVTNWVHNNIDYNLDYSYDVIDAITVLENRAGVCDEFANITGALLRAKGFPVKYVSGYANSTLDWEAHAWLEVYVPNQGWIPVDATYGEVATVDASHIVISKSTDPSDI